MACVSGVAWLQLDGNVKMASSFTCRAYWCPFTPLPSPWGSPSPAGQLDCLPGGWLPRAHKQKLNAWNWHSIISAISYWLKWVIATIQIPGKSQRGPHKGMDTRSSGYGGQSGRHTTTGKKATETQLRSQLFLPPRPKPFKLPASVPQQWSRGDQGTKLWPWQWLLPSPGFVLLLGSSGQCLLSLVSLVMEFEG